MVAINGREVISRAVGVLNTQYRCLGEFFFGRPTTLSRSRSFVSANLKQPIPKATAPPLSTARAEVTPSGQVSRRRKHGRVEPKGYNDLAKDNSTLFIPGGFRKERPKKQPTRVKARAPEVNDEPIDCDPESCDDHEGQWADRDMTVEEQVLVMRGLNDLILQKRALEKQFTAKAASGRVKPQTAERKAGSKKETKVADKLREQEQKGGEVNRSSTWKDQRLAQLEKEKEDIKGRLARERIERQHSRYHRKLEEQQRRRESEEHWKQLREKDAKSAALREGHLIRENVLLQGDLQFKHDAYLRACNEREQEREEREKERIRRLRAEENVRQWKELMEQYFPGGQLPQQQSRPQKHRSQSQSQSRSQSVQNQLPPSPQAQFELYDKKWEVLRSGVDIDGTTKVHLIDFSQIPWPVIDMGPGDLNPSNILPEHVVKFFLHPLRGEGKSRKSIAKDELRKWHSDKFDRIVLSKVREEDKRAAAEVAGMIARVLTDMKNFN